MALDEDECRITVRRTHIWEDSLRVLTRIDPKKRLKVSFIGEAAIDDCGPHREYHRLVLSTMMKQSHVLAGPVSCKVPQHDALSLQNGEFYFLMVLCLTQRGLAPTFFAPPVVDCLFQGTSRVIPRITDVPDYNLQEWLKYVLGA